MRHITVYLYSNPSCQPCKMIAKKVRGTGSEPRVIDVQQDAEAYTFVTEALGHSSVPVVVVRDTETDEIITHWSGYKPSELTPVLEILNQQTGSHAA